jgi:hypothetical protein
MSKLPRYGTIFQAVLQYAAPMTAFAAPWGFVPPSVDCYTHIADPAAALRQLLTQYDAASLERAGVMTREPDGQCRLAPALCDPSGLIVPLRVRIGSDPFALLTQVDCLPTRQNPIRAGALDCFTRSLAREHRHIVATTSIREYALYRSLGLPVILCIGLRSLSESGLRAIDSMFQKDWSPEEPEYIPMATPARKSPTTAPPTSPLTSPPSPAPAPAPPPSDPRPILLLAGWSLLDLDANPDPAIREAAAYLLQVKRHLKIQFAGIAVAEPGEGFVDNLKFRANFGSVGPVRETLIKHALRPQRCMEYLCGATGPKINDHPAVLANLLDAYASGSGNDPYSPTVQEALKQYEEVTRTTLIEPLLRKGLSDDDPAIGAAYAHVATITTLLHNMAPTVIDQQRRRLNSARLRDDEAPISEPCYRQFKGLTGQATEILAVLARLELKRGPRRGR